MRFLPAEIIRKLDFETIASGVPGKILMEKAGFGAFNFLVNVAAPAAKRFLVFAGKGNNAGDAFVIARYLIQNNFFVEIICLAEFDDYKGDAALNLKKLLKLSPKISVINNPKNCDSFYWHGDIIIDGLLGTGIRGSVSGLFNSAIKKINELDARVLAIDIPSGLNCDTGEICGGAVKANWTVTFANPKLAFLTESGSDIAGRVEVIDIGIPEKIKKSVIKSDFEVQSTFFVDCNQQNLSIAHKNTFGHLLVIAGSVGMTGAAFLTAKAAISSGCGLVTLALPRSALQLIAPAIPSCMTFPLEDNGQGFFIEKSADILLEKIDKFDAVAIGPGIRTNSETIAFLEKILPKLLSKKIVIDADALNIISINKQLLNLLNENNVITPHPGEFERLSGIKPDKTDLSRIDAAKKIMKNHKFTLLLKGHHTVITSGLSKKIFINLTGNYGMATAGSGDVLTGIIGAFLARKIPPLDAAVSAAYVHGLAGDIAAANISEFSVTAEQIINYLGKSFLYSQKNK